MYLLAVLSRHAQDLIDGRSDGAVAFVEVLARAGLVCVVAVHGHVAAVGVVYAVGLAGRPDQLLDAVALADVGHQLDQGAVCCVGHSVTQRMTTGYDRLKMLNLVFWKKSHTLQGAAMAVNVSYDTAIDYHGDFIMLVAFFRDLITYEELKGNQKIALKSRFAVL